MSDKPILFSATMVKALLAGTKTQTRRIVMSGEEIDKGPWLRVRSPNAEHGWQVGLENFNSWKPIPVRIHVGDRLYVREAWRPSYGVEGYREDLGRVAKPSDFDPKTTAIEYLADGTFELNGKNRPGIHMPTWASRITLHVTEARVQRLQDISEEDARAEGVDEATCYRQMTGRTGDEAINPPLVGPIWALGYMRLWDSINGTKKRPYPSKLNPWIAAYTFEVEHCNIAEARKP